MNKLKQNILIFLIAAAFVSVPIFALLKAQNITVPIVQPYGPLIISNITAGGNYTLPGVNGTGYGNLTLGTLTTSTNGTPGPAFSLVGNTATGNVVLNIVGVGNFTLIAHGL